MTYTAFDVIHGIASFGALAWMLYLVARSPGDVRRWAVAGLLAGWSVAYPFGIAASAGTDFLGVDAMTARYVQHGLLLVAAYSLVCFFQFSALEARLARGRAAREAVGLAVALAVVTAANLAIPADLRVPAATVTSTPGEGPVGVDSIAAFYIAANSYLLYAFAAACVWTRRYARGAEPRLRRGLRVASGGLAATPWPGRRSWCRTSAGGPAPRPRRRSSSRASSCCCSGSCCSWRGWPTRPWSPGWPRCGCGSGTAARIATSVHCGQY
ncbi:MAG: hypothetical protein GEV28_08005 [Actinophytocola sp.]|nr:hypothetical protein [Actinophytocola sp.]MPZ80329.1 hypothetical protein [Actinophytocola sp.]